MTEPKTPSVEHGLLLQFRFSGSKSILENHTLLPSARIQFVIGRSNQAGHPTDLAQSRVLSRHHATITLDSSGQFAIIEDHNSSHGTKVIRGATKLTLTPEHPSVKVKPGDVIKLGKELKKDGITHKPLYCYVNPAKNVKSGASPTSASSISPFRHIVLTEAEQLGAIEISDDDEDDDDVQITAYRSSVSSVDSHVSNQGALSPLAAASQQTQATIEEGHKEEPNLEKNDLPSPASDPSAGGRIVGNVREDSYGIVDEDSAVETTGQDNGTSSDSDDEQEVPQPVTTASAFLVAGPLGDPDDFLADYGRKTDDEEVSADDSDNNSSTADEEAQTPLSEVDGLTTEQQLAEERSHEEIFPGSQYIGIYKVLDKSKGEQHQSTAVANANAVECDARSMGLAACAPAEEPTHHMEAGEEPVLSQGMGAQTDTSADDDHRQRVDGQSSSVSSAKRPAELIGSTVRTFYQDLPEAENVQESAGFAEAPEQLVELGSGPEVVAGASSVAVASEATQQSTECKSDQGTRSRTPSPRGEKRPAEAEEPSEDAGEAVSKTADSITCSLETSKMAGKSTESRTKRQRTKDIAVGAALGAVSTFITLAMMAGTDGGM